MSVSGTSVLDYAHNSDNQLTGTVKASGTSVSYGYDTIGRRVSACGDDEVYLYHPNRINPM